MAGIHNELEPEVKISLTESWIVASHRPAEHTRVSNEHKLSRHLRVESVEAHKAGITLFAANCWSTAAHHCAWPTASRGWWPPPLLPLPLAILSLLLQPLRRLLRRDHPSPASSRQAGQPCCGHRHGHPCGCMSSPLRRKEGRQPRCWVAPEAKVCAGCFVNKVGNAVCGLRLIDASRISAVRGSTFRDLSIGTLHYGALSRYYCVLPMVIKLPR